MTRKDYIAIATALHGARLEGHGLSTASVKYIVEQWELCVDATAAAMAYDNPRFDRERFLKACREGC